MTQQATDFTLDTAAELAAARAGADRGPEPVVRSPGAGCGATTSRSARWSSSSSSSSPAPLAPWYAEHVAGTGPNNTHLTDKVTVNGEQVDVVSAGGTVQDSGDRRAEDQARHRARATVSGRRTASTSSAPTRSAATSRCALLYGGRNSLLIGISSALICTLLRDRARADRRLLRRVVGLGDHARVRSHRSASRDPARDRARRRAVDQRLPPLGRSTSSREASGFRS